MKAAKLQVLEYVKMTFLYLAGYREPDIEISLEQFKELVAKGQRHWATGELAPESIGSQKTAPSR